MLPMKDLAAIFGEAGAADVRTYINSGNVIFSAKAATAKVIPGLVAEMIAKGFGFRPPVALRTAAEIEQVAASNPFLTADADLAILHVSFLLDLPDAAGIAAVEGKRSENDFFEFRGQEIYLYFPNGVLKSKLTNAFLDSRLKTISTSRNWRTVVKLRDMVQGGG